VRAESATNAPGIPPEPNDYPGGWKSAGNGLRQVYRYPDRYSDWFKPLNLGIHEAGHYVFGFLGRWVMIAGAGYLLALALTPRTTAHGVMPEYSQSALNSTSRRSNS